MPVIEALPATRNSDAAEDDSNKASDAITPTRARGQPLGLLAAATTIVALAISVGWLTGNQSAGDDRDALSRQRTAASTPQPSPKFETPTPTPEVVVPEPEASPAPEPLPTPAELEAREAAQLKAAILLGGRESEQALLRLVNLSTEPAKRAMREVVEEKQDAKRALTAIARQGARHHTETLSWALLESDAERGEIAANALAAMRSARALELLRTAERDHPDAHVRQAALSARRSIFKIEGEQGDEGTPSKAARQPDDDESVDVKLP